MRNRGLANSEVEELGELGSCGRSGQGRSPRIALRGAPGPRALMGRGSSSEPSTSDWIAALNHPNQNHDYGDYQEQVDKRSSHRHHKGSKQPKNEKNDDDSSEHGDGLLWLTTPIVGLAPLEVCAVMHSRFPSVNAILPA